MAFHCGIDVGKHKLHVCLIWIKGKRRNKSVANTPSGRRTLYQWLERQLEGRLDALQAILEPTAHYHEALAEELVELGVRVATPNPKQVNKFAQGIGFESKRDRQDAFVLARMGESLELAAYTPPAPEVKTLRALLARLEAVEKDYQRESNRLEHALTAQAPQEVIDSIGSSRAFLEAERERLERMIDEHIDRHPPLKGDRELLESIRGVSAKSSREMLSIIHRHAFDRAKQVASYVGVNPKVFESGTSKELPPCMSKMGSGRVRAKLYMAAVSAIQHNPDVRAFYQRLRRRGKAKMAALGAAMRKLVHICFGVIKNQTPYKPQIA
jgi:transposase